MTKTKRIRIRCVTPGVTATGDGIGYFVEHESERAIYIDNHAENPWFRARATLSKMPNGNLANSAGQEFEIVYREEK